MRGSKIFGAVALAWLAAVAVTADAQRSPSPQHLLPQAQGNPQKNSGPAKKKAAPPEHHMGDWLEAHKNLPPDQQERALESDPGFKNLPPGQQAKLRDQLRRFNSLPPAQRERALLRMKFLASLTPQQRQQIRLSQQQLQ
ncbi:MAG: DUF3106 domain-containing protein, partial [Terriglobales bacterium]